MAQVNSRQYNKTMFFIYLPEISEMTWAPLKIRFFFVAISGLPGNRPISEYQYMAIVKLINKVTLKKNQQTIF